MSELRWEQADKPRAQETLFDEPVFEREPGRGEFTGIEFLHVRAHRIINEVRNAPFGFRYTINAYRGCTHACSYCQWGETPILLADGRTKPLAELRPGDRVYGTVRRGASRRYVPTTVLDHWSTVKPAYRVVLEDGTTLVASGDHRYLTDRGWKHVAGANQGPGRRPHLTTNNSLVGVGRFATGPKATPDYQRGYLFGVIRDDDHGGDRQRARSTPLDHEPLDRIDRYLDEQGRTAVPDAGTWPASPTDDWCRGFLAGVFDADGTYTGGILRIFDAGNGTIARVEASLRRFGFTYVVGTTKRPSETHHVRLLGGLREHLRFFHTVDPAATRKRAFDGAAVKSDAQLGVVAVEPLGLDLPMFDITTETGDFIADGVISHNCFARPSHTYLGLDADRDFERRIVVKVNAVSLLRRELDPRRWTGDLIAMGTNTDPYQRCEGKYRLTRGIVEALVEQANPFSILTKSTLVLRDLPLLVEAAKRTDVRVNLSIGTLDEEVWRTTEPGTPHPARRVRAVETLNAAGVPCGVLVAPVLPDISDRPDQLEAVVRACLDAGAQSITTVALHLRPGVKEVFLSRLGETHPDLLDRYRRRYRDRSYAPPADRDAIETTVRDLVRRYGTPSGAADPAEPVDTAAAMVDAPRRRQLRQAREALDHPPSTQLQLL